MEKARSGSGCLTNAIFSATIVILLLAALSVLGNSLGSGYAGNGGEFRINSHNVDLTNSGGAAVVIGHENQVSSSSYPCQLDHETGLCQSDLESNVPEKSSGYIAFGGLVVFAIAVLAFMFHVITPNKSTWA